ncbi:Uridine-cytidine kinase C [Gossypium australe]|uniref:Uridine-cytidine kinase C n=1 Tax=Gossypium australe TaxID=47621 RepID=A0A5B6WPH8_9ROSI|nr:Uridine-cytidine kinase C [Gossypium australe]
MDDEVVQRVFQEGGRDYFQQQPSTSTSSSSSILQSLPLHVVQKTSTESWSFDHGYYLLVKSIQELREKKEGLVTVGIGGPSGSGKTSLAEKVASVIGCTVIPMENYRGGTDEGTDLDSIDFDALIRNLEDLIEGKDTKIPVFDFHQKKRVGSKAIKSAMSGVVIVDGTYALHAKLRSLLDIRVAVVGGVHFSLLSKVRYDIGDSCSLDYLIDSIFPLFRKHIEPDLHHAQIRINNSFVSSFREAVYKLKCRSEVGRMTLGGLLALGYNVVVSYKRASTSVNIGSLSLSLETIDTLGETFLVLRGTDRKTVGAEALRMGITGQWLTKSYLEMILERKGVPRLNTPPLVSATSVSHNQEKDIAAPKPIRTTPNLVSRLEDLAQPWTRSPTKSKMEPVLPTWHFASSDRSHGDSVGMPPLCGQLNNLSIPFPQVHHGGVSMNFMRRLSHVAATGSSAFRDTMKLAPMPDSYDLDRGLLLAVQGIQFLLENKSVPVIVGIGGPSGSGKTSLAHKMANIVGCEVVSLESYFKPEQVKDFKYDDFNSLDLPLLSKNIGDIKHGRKTKIPVFNLETGSRSCFKELEISEDCGVIIFEGVYALHPEIRKSLDLWIAVVGGVHSHLISRVQRDKSRVGCFMSQNEIMMTVFPIFQQHIEPHLVHAHLKIRNDFDPVLSPESSLFVLKSNKQVAYQDILNILDSAKFCSSVQNFIDIYLRLPGTPANGHIAESDCVRVRICEGRFALLIREPIREGNFIIQPKVDFDISISTVSGLLNLGYQAVAYIEASALIYQDGKILIEVDHLQDAPSPYLQIKGVNKEAVAAAGSALKLDGSYTTKSYLQIILERLPLVERSYSGIHTHQAARLQELVESIQSQGGSSPSESSQSREVSPMDGIIEDMQCRIRRLERWHTINTVLWTFLMSALIGYSLYQRKRQ